MFYTRVNFPFSPVTYSILLSFGPQEQASPTSSEASECHHAGTPGKLRIPAETNITANWHATLQNLSFVLQSVKQVKFEDRPVPEIKSPYDVIVEVKYTGICGSDVYQPLLN